ncbi:M56 family metallopeptidase [Neptunitalea lumnitzerae]|uniref:Peptidase M56 domain-containing protein n=1 Tax=Neptunitalea lumnitzerae TaxID=2965509 RepID=A0ABQ5MGC9_9FLAO|nr:M56 family metallopeptidase [Neptunitalea sp. Y10]GLB48473.1 hypothetical protein Y10_08410 [Neptunitalea sp. Y10]
MAKHLFLAAVFQFLLVLVYDVLLKKLTFFKYNRWYLLLTPICAYLIPFIKGTWFLKSNTSMLIFQRLDLFTSNSEISNKVVATQTDNLLVVKYIIITGVLISTLLFAVKIIKIYNLKRKGYLNKNETYTLITVNNSRIAFSFFNYLFIGNEITKQERQYIISHELVHIKQKHTYDLLYFEIQRILFWFNPLVYIYQKRISELHEFIADSSCTNTHSTAQYNTMLLEVFQTSNISIINQFYNQSLIKKRIDMLQKSKSKKVVLYKYLSIIPLLIICALINIACTSNSEDTLQLGNTLTDEQIKAKAQNNMKEKLALGKSPVELVLEHQFTENEERKLSKEEFYELQLLFQETIKNFKDSDTKDSLLNKINNTTYEVYLSRKNEDF